MFSASEVMSESKETQLQLWVSCTATRASKVLLHTEQGHAKHSQAKLSGVWCVRACKGHESCIPTYVVHLAAIGSEAALPRRTDAPAKHVPARQVRESLEKGSRWFLSGFCCSVHPGSPLHNTALLPRDLKYRGRHAAAL